MKPIFLSREGVIHHRIEGGVTHRTKLEFIESSIQAIVELTKKGFSIIIVTHQPALSLGLLDLDELEAIHAAIIDKVEQAGGNIAGIFYCGHDESDHCYCRPPATGLLDVVEIEFDCSIENAFYFCDNAMEAEAARQKACQVTILNTSETLQHHLHRLSL